MANLTERDILATRNVWLHNRRRGSSKCSISWYSSDVFCKDIY